MMKYLAHLEQNKPQIKRALDDLIKEYKVQPVGNGYIDCIVLKCDFANFIHRISSLGVLVTEVSWWCHVQSDNGHDSACPHGMGGPLSRFHKGWFSELQNEMLSISRELVDSIMEGNSNELIKKSNEELIELIYKTLQVPFKYTPTDYIEDNNCVVPALWLLIPDTWESDN